MARIDFNAEEVEPTSFDAIPAGEYPAIIISSEMKETQAKNGEYLELCLKIIGDKYKGRLVWDRLNLKNNSPKAVQIAEGTLAAICRSVNPPVMHPKDSSELHDKPLLIKVSVRPATESYGETNDVKAYKPISGEMSTKTSTQEEVSPTGKKMPWDK